MTQPEFTTGTYISAVGHTALIGWLLLGWGLNHDTRPFEVTEVSVVSGAEYAAIVAATTPSAQVDQPSAPSVPPTETPPPETTPEQPVTQPTPEVAPAPPTDEAPPPDPPEALPPQTQVDESVPVLQAPEPPTPPPAPDLPVINDRPQPRPADRVTETPAPPPPPDAEAAPELRPEVTDAPAELPSPVEEPQEAAAPEESTDRIVTEADIASGAPERAIRPPSRPANLRPPAPAPTEVATADSANAAEPDTSDTAVNDLLAELTAETPAETVAAPPVGDPGPPMTRGDEDGFRITVQSCWTVDPGAEAGVTVTVAFSLGRDRRVIDNSIDLIASTGSQAAVDAAFRNARSAILRCQNKDNGFALRDEQYEQWRDVEILFDPSGMRQRF